MTLLRTLIPPQGTPWAQFVFLGSPRELIAVWLAGINLIAFCVFGLDKWKARRKERHADIRRVPEKVLFSLAILGGSAGALLGMKVFHHKTLHRSFRIGIPVILLVQLAVGAALWLWLHGMFRA